MNDFLLRQYLKLKALAMREEGQDLVEYALILALVAVGAVSVLKPLGTAVNGIITSITGSLTAATGSGS